MRAGEIVAEGQQAQIFAWDDGRVLKLFRRAGRDAVAEEARKTALARSLGCPAPAVYDVVEVDGRFGFVMERLAGPTMMELLNADPSTATQRARSLADLHARLAGLAGADLPPLEPRLQAMIADSPLPRAASDEAQRCLDACPRGSAVYHGDFHPLNVISTERGLYAIDWANAACAHPSADVAMTYLLTTTALLAELLPADAAARAEPVRAAVDAAYLGRYLELAPVSRDQVQTWMRPLAAARLTDVQRTGFTGVDRARLTAFATGEHPGL